MEKQTPNPENKAEAKLEGNTLWKLPVILMSKNKTLKYDQGIDEEKKKLVFTMTKTEKKKKATFSFWEIVSHPIEVHWKGLTMAWFLHEGSCFLSLSLCWRIQVSLT